MIWVGIIGMLLIVIAWVPQTLENVRKKKTGLNKKFIFLYLSGSLSLLIYSILISDLVFSLLNGAASLQALINLIIKLGEKK